MAWLLKMIGGRLKATLIGIAVAALGIAIAFIRKSGVDAEKTKQLREDLKAAKTVATEKTRSRGQTDEQLDAEIDRWTR